MGSPHYTPSGKPVAGSAGSSQDIRDEFALIEAGIDELNYYPMCLRVDDINTAQSWFIVVPWSCTFEEAHVIQYAGNATADTNFSFEIGGIAVTMSTALVVAAADNIYTVNSGVASAANSIVSAQALEIITDGGGTGVVPAGITLLFRRTA